MSAAKDTGWTGSCLAHPVAVTLNAFGRCWVCDNAAAGFCALSDGRCLVHDAPDTMEHHFSAHPAANND